MAWPGSLDGNTEGGNMTNVYVSTAMKRDGVLEEEERPHVEPPPLLTSSITHQTRPSAVGTSEKALMKRTLVAQSKKIQQLMTKVDSMEAEREAMRQQVDALRMAVFEASTRAEQTAEQCKRDAVDAAVHEITRDREAFADGRREALKRIGELEDALEIALKAAGGVHKQLLDLGLSCEDLGKTSVHLSIAAKEAQPEDKPALDVAGVTIEAIVGVMRTMEGSGVFDILDPVEEDSEDAEDPATFALDAGAAAADDDEDDDAAATDGAVGVSVDAAVDAADPLEGDGPPSSAVLDPTTASWDVQSGGGGSIEGERNDDNDDEEGREEEEKEEGEEAEGGDEEEEGGAGLREGQEAEEEEEGGSRQPALVARGSDGVREAADGADGRGREGRSISTSVKHGSAEWDRGSAAGGSWKSR